MSSVSDWEATSNPVKENRAGNIGKAVDRYEGPLKVTGTAPYAYEVEPPAPPAYGVLVSAPIARGRITAVDTAAAEASPGVMLVWTYKNVPAQGPRPERYDFFTPAPRPALESDQVYHFGQQVAVVVADTLENAQAAAALVDLTFEDDAKAVTFHDHFDEGVQPPGESDVEIGDFEAAFAAAPATIDDVWRTPLQNHCQMEPCATTAWWDGDKLTVHTSVQMVRFAQNSLAETLMLPHK
ncbi:MAG: aerobic-type carbon monoxide dehydrogenase, large subunit CoxL/CutL-like protein, partial [Phenylobacterium sp.]|nr:aerobic-type carbon monoxide dehydrogenase, large subunit CoxL/CutL-like protein [Phenylobacterium sp.]